ncbi:MAG: NADH:flavin oxidoreductase [Pseudobdellovibrionaceae bacterium]
MESILFQPFHYKNLHLKNRVVMSPMTRGFSPEGVPTDEVTAYYHRRAVGQVGLIISEGTLVERPSASNNPNYPNFYGESALQNWKKIIDAVHSADGKMAPQLWHQGIVKPMGKWLPPTPFEGPSGLVSKDEMGGVAMSEQDIQMTIQAFADAAQASKNLGFDTLEVHGAHGYLIDQFFWSELNKRKDDWGGSTLKQRSRFAVEVIKAIRKAVGPDYPIILRLSQWKQQDYNAKLAQTPIEMEEWLSPLVQAGVDIFHCSQRRFWEPEFAGSDLNFAGWAKKITGCPTITVGSVGLSGEFIAAFKGEGAQPSSLDRIHECLARGDFDLVGVGRALLADPYWVEKIKENKIKELKGFQKEDLNVLY